MTQSSLPQAGDETLNAAYVDSGPYTGDEWADLFRILFTTDQQATQGVLRGVDNELIPANPATRTVTIGTGAGIVNGHVLINDASVSIGVDAGAARDDSLVMLENNSNAAISAGAATNYNTEGNVDIPPYSARLAVVKDDAANFSQTNTLWMTRLATFTTGAGALTSFTDVRAYCQFSGAGGPATRQFLVSADSVFELDTSTLVRTAVSSDVWGWRLTDNEVCYAHGQFSVPSDFASSMSVQAVVRAVTSSGNLFARTEFQYGACGELDATHTDDSGVTATTALVVATITCPYSVTLTNATVGDIVDCQFVRDAVDAQDTIDNLVYFKGWLVTYTPSS
jgi:hypothetical protein